MSELIKYLIEWSPAIQLLTPYISLAKEIFGAIFYLGSVYFLYKRNIIK